MEFRNNRKTKTQYTRKGKQQRDVHVVEPGDIPQIQLLPTFHSILRYRNIETSTDYQDFTLNIKDLLGGIGVIAATTGSANGIARSVLIKRISIYGAPKGDTTDTDCQAFIDWHNSTGFSSGNKKADFSVSNAKPLFLTSKPPRGSISEFWSELNSMTYATVRIPRGGIIDVDVVWKGAESTTNSYVLTLGFTPGNFYRCKLDFSAGGSPVLLPVGMASFG
jgi:hypothetical protein